MLRRAAARRRGGGVRPVKRGLWLVGLALVIALGAVGGANAAPNTDLYDPNVRVSDGFYPCPGQTDFTRGPLPSECYNASYQPLAFPAIDTPQTACDAAGTSTIHIDRTTGTAFVPSGVPWLNGSVHWQLTATVGAQSGPAMPEIQPFPGDGARIGSFGFQ